MFLKGAEADIKTPGEGFDPTAIRHENCHSSRYNLDNKPEGWWCVAKIDVSVAACSQEAADTIAKSTLY